MSSNRPRRGQLLTEAACTVVMAAFAGGLLAAPPLPEQAARERRIASLKEVVAVRPKDVGSWHDLADLYREAGRWDETIGADSKAIAGHPKYAVAYWGRGRAKMEKGAYAAARADFTSAIGLWESRHGFDWFVTEERPKDEHVQSYRDRGVSFGHEKRWAEAVADLSLALRLRPDDASLLYDRAHLEEKGGKKEDAAVDFRRAGLIHAEAHNVQGARECAERLRTIGAAPAAEEIEARLKPAMRGSALP